VKPFVAVIISLLMIGCSGPAKAGRRIVYVVDASGSVPPEARLASIEAIERHMTKMERGDRIAVMPVTGSIYGETLGRVLRFELSATRQSYDSDRRKLLREMRDRVSEFAVSVSAQRRGSQFTDLLGTFELAVEELENGGVLVCLSDFVQDDAQFNFKRDRRLARDETAKNLARELAEPFGARLVGTDVHLGAVPSSDVAVMSANRRRAIQQFWITFFEAQGATVQWATDGPGRAGVE
jgi:hypothetical protein